LFLAVDARYRATFAREGRCPKQRPSDGRFEIRDLMTRTDLVTAPAVRAVIDRELLHKRADTDRLGIRWSCVEWAPVEIQVQKVIGDLMLAG